MTRQKVRMRDAKPAVPWGGAGADAKGTGLVTSGCNSSVLAESRGAGRRHETGIWRRFRGHDRAQLTHRGHLHTLTWRHVPLWPSLVPQVTIRAFIRLA